MPLRPDEVYEGIKALEEVFPLPIPLEVINVGRFDCATGDFSGLKVDRWYESVADLFPGGYPGDRIWFVNNRRMEMRKRGPRVEFRSTPAPKINAVYAHLTYGLKNTSACTDDTWQLTVNHHSRAAPLSEETITLNVKDATRIEWSIQVGDQSYEGELFLQRKPSIGAGVFTLPFVPLLLLYEPRCDANKQSTATYETSYAFSTELTTSFSTEEATTRPVAPQGYLGAQNAQTKLNTLATVFENVPIPGGEAIPGALRNIASGLGEMDAELTEGQIEATQNSLRTTFKTQDTWSTGENDGGPGIGDILVYLSNVKMLWIAYNGNLTLTPLGWDAEASHSAQWIRTNLDTELAHALLSLDPFTDDESIVLDPNRFPYRTTVDISGMGGCREFVEEYTVEQIDQTTSTNYTTRIEHYRPGWLSFLGLGVTEEKTIKCTLTQSCSTSESTVHQNTVKAKLCAGIKEPYIVSIYYDRIFGTFAFESPPTLSKPMISGVVLNPFGIAVTNEPLTLHAAGKTYKTFTDQNGKFKFYTWSIQPGRIRLKVRKSVEKRVELKPGTPIENVTIRLPQFK